MTQSSEPGTARRVWAYLRGDMEVAEYLTGYPKKTTPPVVQRASKDEQLASHLAELAAKERAWTDAVSDGLSSRASTFFALLVGLFPLALVGIGFTAPGEDAGLLRWLGFVLMIAATIALLVAALTAAMASGLGLGVAVRLDFLEGSGAPKTMAELLVEEADAWNYAMVLNMETSRRRARDLYRARRLALSALATALLGLGVIIWSVGGRPAALFESEEVERPAPVVVVEGHSPEPDPVRAD